jgi:hypothetical protein
VGVDGGRGDGDGFAVAAGVRFGRQRGGPLANVGGSDVLDRHAPELDPAWALADWLGKFTARKFFVFCSDKLADTDFPSVRIDAYKVFIEQLVKVSVHPQ